MYTMHRTLLNVVSELSGGTAVAVALCIVIVIGTVMFNILLLNRIKEFEADQSDENFASAKKMQKLAGFFSGLGVVWLTVMSILVRDGYVKFGGGVLFGSVMCIGGIIFNTACLQKYERIKRMHNADIMKRAKGDPSVIFSDDMELSDEEKSIVSQIALNAGVYPQESFKSDEEIFSVIDDPVYAPFEERGERPCPFCGKKNIKKYTVCAYCGQLLPDIGADEENRKNA